MCNNGKTFVNYLSPGIGATATSSPWQLGLTHYTCCNRQMCVNDSDNLPDVRGLDIQVIGGPNLIQDSGQYCCDVRVICDVVYRQVWGCSCRPNSCLQTDTVVVTVCVPCGETLPTVGNIGAVANAVSVQCGESKTNEISINVAFTLETTTAAETDGEGNG